MKKTKVFKIVIAILIAITLFVAFAQTSLAANIDLTKFDSAKDKSQATNKAAVITGKVLNWIQVLGAGYAIVMLVVIGIRWVSASPSGKAQFSKTARYYILGAVFIFAAIGLLQIVKNFTDKAVEQI